MSRHYVAGEFQRGRGPDEPAHVVVLGNEKGGSGKTTLSMHLVVHLLARGFRVATVDLDMRQRSLSRYVHNRVDWDARTRERLAVPNHYEFAPSQADLRSRERAEDFGAMAAAIAEIEAEHDFVVIDTPGHDHHLMRLAHSMADTLVTPLNDSFVDFDVLGHVDPVTYELTEMGHYAAMVRQARRQRRAADGGDMDWVVVRNRMSSLDTRNRQNLDHAMSQLAMRLGFRTAAGIVERVIFREFFPKGLTALDTLDSGNGGREPTVSHLAARREIANLIRALRLPTGEDARRRAEARAAFLEGPDDPGGLPDVFAD